MYTFSRCREACLQLHEDAKNLLKHQLNQEHEEIVRALKYVPQENSYLAFTFEGYLTLSSVHEHGHCFGFRLLKKKTCKNIQLDEGN